MVFEKLDIFNFGKGPDMAMGFVRLSILYVSNQGHQPMSDEKGQVFITFNGEVYNAFDYRDELISKGYAFHSHTDTEVVLNLYMEYGLEGMLERINGMFAICIANIRTREVYLIRDRLGVKPLYYYDTSDAFLYASEVKAFYASEYFDNQLNVDAISEHFVFRYVAGKNTLFKNVYNVLPAHYIKISNNGIEEIRYWDIKSSSDRELSVSDYEDLIDKSVKDRMLSDVKLGVQLSGGIDSSIVTACASRYKEDLESYSVIFEDDSYSEKKWMDMVADKYPIRQHQEYQKIEDFDMEFEKATWFLDTPLNHPNSIGIYNMCSIAKKNDVKVLLTGEGADEGFGGYRRYASFLTAQKYKLLSEISSRLRGTKLSSSKSYEEKFISTGAFVKEDELKKLIPGGSWDEAINTRRDMYKESCEGRDRFSKALNYELKTYLVDILNRQDKMSMAASLETRVPFLNYELIENKDIVGRVIGYEHVIKTIDAWDTAADIDFDKLPQKFVLKCNHTSSTGVIICKDKEKLDQAATIREMNKAMHTDYSYYRRKHVYSKINRKIFAEEFIEDPSGRDINDYKVFVFNGRATYIQVDYDRFTDHHRNFYDRYWNYVPFTTCYPTDPEHQIKKPVQLDELLGLAEKLADQTVKGIPFVRMDFYIVGTRILFGEITFYHGAGIERFYPAEYDRKLGDMIKL